MVAAMKHKAHAPQGDCPHPGKMPFGRKIVAKLAARKRTGQGVYKCECGRYHLFTKSKYRQEMPANETDFEVL